MADTFTGSSDGELIERVTRAAQMRRSSYAEGEVTWRVWGAQHSDTLILLHGSFGSWMHWLRNVEALAQRWRIVTADIPGFGDSGPPPAAREPAGIAQVLMSGYQQLFATSGRVAIAGFSLGAVYAGCLVRAFAAEGVAVAGLALISPGGLGPREVVQPQLARTRGHTIESYRRAAHVHNLAALMFANAENIDDTAVEIQMKNVQNARFRAQFTSRSDMLLEALRNMQIPVLAIWGRHDAFDADITPRVAAVRQAAPQAQIVIIENAAHWVNYEACDLVNAAILEWMSFLLSPYNESNSDNVIVNGCGGEPQGRDQRAAS